jgi:cell wall-associated NlpC family hydrolase
MPLALGAAALGALPAQAATFAPSPPPGFHLMWATRTAMRLGWSATRGAWSYSYRLEQMNGVRVRSGSEPGYYHTVTFSGLHPGWRYRSVVWADPARGPSATLYIALPAPTPLRQYALQWAESQAGTPYVYGDQGQHGYDCSGLVRTAYGHAGIWLPRTTEEMLSDRRLNRESSPRQGDLVFFGTGHVELFDSRDRSFGAESGPEDKHGGVWWYQWWPGNWWPTAFYRVQRAG